ncbi:MAG TPA: glycosyltransferase family 4 protein [Spirochaetota bacterium]|jgi:glycosyltransferase involved in cell wall biosynthesis|nr:glycosyltransferase family 4 protein [Spirochaetota bacterium]HOK00976.1 glycosyltransferase family 4 protein [Spirochaetota bacterium]HOK91303.1 glycosyltransferase family 4 protein [Spirochaetota bacterium]HOQ11782.1 glycosyltransferase family 4 protein [Spirochaetota bacterium]HOV07544.1 glycosyltransferase family 4 protein [Spirochaetota bacterium]
MRVLISGYRGNPYCGGQGIYIYNLSRELAKLGVEVDVMVGPPYPDPLEEWATVYKIENLNIWSIKTKDIPYEKLVRIFSPWNFADYILTRLHMFPEMETYSFRAFFALKKILKEKRYDIIHDIQSLGWATVPMKGYGIPIVTTVHHPLTKDREADLMGNFGLWDKTTTILFYPLVMQSFVIKRLDRVITSFREGITELNKAFGVKPEKVSVVYNGMDVDLFQNTGEPREENALLFVGNTEDSKKGLIYLFEAMTMLPENVTLTIVDDGPPKKMTAADMIKKFNLSHRVKFTGKLSYEALVSLYSRKTILVMSSLFEGFGLPAVEAMACKTPVVVTTAGSLKEVVTEDCGILVPPKDPIALKDAILKLLSDSELRKKMGENGRRRAVENFSWPVAAKNTLKVYEDVIREFRRKR